MTQNTIAQERKIRKTLTGTIVSAKMNKTVVVRVDTVIRHPDFGKVVKRFKKYYAHDESCKHKEGDVVTIVETRPLSKMKCWRVVEETK